MSEAPTVIAADPALRLDAPQAPRRWRGRLAAAMLVAIALELGVFGAVWFERETLPPPQPQEIPIEIVEEPPPPPPPPPQSPEAQPQPQEVEKPATDAPREGKSDHDDENVAEKPVPAAAPPPPPVATPSPEATQPAVETPAPELPKSAEAEAPPPEKAPAPAPTSLPAKPNVNDVLAKALAVPDIEAGGVAIQSPVTGGNAKATFLTKIFGVVQPRFHVPPLARAYGRVLQGVALMQIDGRGRLLQRGIREGSGSMELDEAAMEAIAAASKSLPIPPQHATVVVEWHYNSAD